MANTFKAGGTIYTLTMLVKPKNLHWDTNCVTIYV
jgi:hypothetical protein